MKIPPVESPGLPPGVTPHMAQRSKKKGYFFKGFSVDTNEYCISAIKSATAKMALSDLRLLDQKTMSQETFVSLLFVWADLVVNDRNRGIAFLEKELAEPLKIIEPIVRKEKALADALEAQEKARAEDAGEGFTKPKGARKKKGPSDGRTHHP